MTGAKETYQIPYTIYNYDYLFSEGFDDNQLHNYQQLKQKYRAAGNDFETLTRIANLIFTLSDEYQVITCHHLHKHKHIKNRMFTLSTPLSFDNG